MTAIKEKDITSTLPRVGKGLLPFSLWWACECGYHDLGCPWTNGGKSGETYSVADKVRRPLLCHRDGCCCCCCCCCCCILYFLYVVTRKNHGTDGRTHSFTLRCLKMCSFNLSAVATVPTWKRGACEGVLALTKRKQLGWTWRSIKLWRNSFYFFLLSKTLFSCLQFTVGFFSSISECFGGWYHIFVTLIPFYFYLNPYVPYLYFYFGLFRRTTVWKIVEVLRTDAQAKTHFVTLMSYRLNFQTLKSK